MPDDRDTKPPAKPPTRYSQTGPEPRGPRAPIARVQVRQREPAQSDSGLGEEQNERDERLLRALKQMGDQLQTQINEAKEAAEQARQQSTRPPAAPEKGDRGEPGKPATWVQSLPAIIIAVTGLVAAIGALARKDSDESATVYKELRDAQAKTNEAIAKNTANDEARWNWIAGFVKALPGVKVVEQPGAPQIEPLDLAPAPVVNPRTGKTLTGAPPIQVRDPLPRPLPSTPPVKLPPPEQLFGKKP